MQTKYSWTFLLVFALTIKIFSLFPAAVEKFYSNGIYPGISFSQRFLFGWIPFSIGDIFYLVAGIYLLKKLAFFIRAAFKKQLSRQRVIDSVKRVSFTCLVIYVLFNVLWGLNYNRVPVASQMALPLESYSTRTLSNIVQVLITKLNSFDSTSRSYRIALQNKKTLFHEALDSYSKVAKEFPALTYIAPSVKPSLFSYAGNYLGFTGYYNPFSGEAQANTTVPPFTQPFTTCHEIGHQLGFAKEDEANFAGFLAARSSSNPSFRYSVYFDMYYYAIRELYLRDSVSAKRLNAELNSGVKQDIKTMRQFYKKYENPFEPIIRKLYGNYLRANEQPEGLHSYNEVIALLIAHYRKYGYI